MRRYNTYAVDMIALRFIISIVIIATIILITIVASNTFGPILAEHQVEQQCLMLESSLSTMMGSGVSRDIDEVDAADGTKRIQTFILPDSLIYLSFGGDPDEMNTGELSPKLTEDGSVIFYKVNGGRKQSIWLPKETYKFREGVFTGTRWVINGIGQSFILCSSGKTTLVFELVRQDRCSYILVRPLVKGES
jgi:hypothetical protein